MKKTTIVVIAALSMVCAAPVFADMDINIKEAKNDIITVSDSLEAADNASILILNPGKKPEDITDGDYEKNSETVQYFDSKYFTDKAVSFDVQMNTKDGGLFNVMLKTSAGIQNGTFEFYPSAMKEDIISFINGAKENLAFSTAYDDENTMLDRVMRIYSLYDFPLYAKGNKDKIASAIISQREALSSKAYADDTDVMYLYLKKACLLAAYNNSDENLIFENGSMIYRDIAGLSGTSEIEDYDLSLGTEGRALMNKSLMGRNFKTTDDLKTTFKNELLYYAIKYYKQMGYGHLDYLFARYKTDYINCGFLLNSLTSGKKNQVYSKFMAASASDIYRLAAAFNKALTDTDGGNKSGGGGGGGSSGGTKTSIMYPMPVNGQNDTDTTETEMFGDLETVAWAKEAIAGLANLGAVNGRSEGIFAPNDSVKRSEFVKIIVSALNIETDGAECAFEDVQNSWSYKYVAAANRNGIINGISDSFFGADEVISREQGAVIIYRTAQKYGKKLAAASEERFDDDGDISSYAKEAVYTLLASGIISGRGNNVFAPKATMTRAEAAKLIYTLLCE